MVGIAHEEERGNLNDEKEVPLVVRSGGMDPDFLVDEVVEAKRWIRTTGQGMRSRATGLSCDDYGGSGE